MDLAMQLGGSVDALSRSMTEAEFHRWARYARKFGMPFRRLELMLAQLTMVVARSMGGAKQATTADFMLKPVDDELPANVTRIDAARAAFGFNPRRRKKA
jgi:hypothetical protein